MLRGTTPTHVFSDIGVDLRDADAVYLTYEQNNKVVLEKEKTDLEISKDSISVMLSQEDTLLFLANENPVYIQFRYRLANGKAGASDIVTVPVSRIIKDGVI